MGLFNAENRNRSDRHQKIYALYEIAYTVMDFIAATAFLTGSIMFFYPEYEVPAIWLFVIGSTCFAIKPTLRLTRELQYAMMGDIKDLADRLEKQ